MTHRAENIMDAVVTTLTGLTTTDTRVERGRIYSVETAPALTIEMGQDFVDREASDFVNANRQLVVKIIAYVKANSEPDSVLNTIREEVYNALIADRTLGATAGVIDIWLDSDDEPELSGESDQAIAKQQLNYVVKYRHSYTDAGA